MSSLALLGGTPVSKLAHAAEGLARKLNSPAGAVSVWGWYSDRGPTLVVELDPSVDVRPPNSYMGFAVDIRVRHADSAVRPTP
jgi:hypothetical protein